MSSSTQIPIADTGGTPSGSNLSSSQPSQSVGPLNARADSFDLEYLSDTKDANPSVLGKQNKQRMNSFQSGDEGISADDRSLENGNYGLHRSPSMSQPDGLAEVIRERTMLLAEMAMAATPSASRGPVSDARISEADPLGLSSAVIDEMDEPCQDRSRNYHYIGHPSHLSEPQVTDLNVNTGTNRTMSSRRYTAGPVDQFGRSSGPSSSSSHGNNRGGTPHGQNRSGSMSYTQRPRGLSKPSLLNSLSSFIGFSNKSRSSSYSAVRNSSHHGIENMSHRLPSALQIYSPELTTDAFQNETYFGSDVVLPTSSAPVRKFNAEHGAGPIASSSQTRYAHALRESESLLGNNHNDIDSAHAPIDSHSYTSTRHLPLQRTIQESCRSMLGYCKNNIEDVKPAALYQNAIRALPAVFLGVLLNALDAVSYGLIIFPSAGPFKNFGAEGVAMFLISTIISQLTFSCGLSVFGGGNASMMIVRWRSSLISRLRLLSGSRAILQSSFQANIEHCW